MNSLMKNGYAWMAKVSIVSMQGNREVTYWGCACPVDWVYPSYGMETIVRRGKFGPVSGEKDRIVIVQTDTLEELENSLLQQAIERWPDNEKEESE